VLQGVAVCCSMLQCVAGCCRVLQRHMTLLSVSGPSENDYEVVSTLCVAGYCRVLQCVAVCCSVLQHVVVCCRVLQCVAASHDAAERLRAFRERLQGSQYVVCCRVLQGVAVCCRMVQCAADDAVRCSVVNVLQCDMTCVAV